MTKRVRIIIAVALVACVGIVTTLAVAQEQHGAQPNQGHQPRGPEGHGDPDPKAGMHDTHHPEGGHAGPEHHAGPAPINWTDISDPHRPAFIALVINFGLLFGAYYVLGKKPIVGALKQRRVTIGKAIEDARDMLKEAKERAKKYQADLKNADADAATAKASLVAAGKGEVERLLTEANEKADRMKRDAERLVEQERKQVRQDLLLETVDVALGEATKILEKSVNAQDHARLAEDLIAELSKVPAARDARVSGGAS
jgi:F-type H+-transporting ATPase subunit b